MTKARAKRRVGSRYFVYNLSRILKQVKRGKLREVVVTVHGTPAFKVTTCTTEDKP